MWAIHFIWIGTTNVTHNNDQYPFCKEHLRHRFGDMMVCTLATVKAIHNATKEYEREQQKTTTTAAASHKRQLHMLIASIKVCMCQVYSSYPCRTITIATATTTLVRRAIPLSQIQWFSILVSCMLEISFCTLIRSLSFSFIHLPLYTLFHFISSYHIARWIFHFVCTVCVWCVLYCWLLFVTISIDAQRILLNSCACLKSA